MDPFGVPRGVAATWDARVRGFVDGQSDASTQLTHLGAREYDPALGKFISVDPLVDTGDPQTLNAYAYSNNNPVTFSDPEGTMYAGVHGGDEDYNVDHSKMVDNGTLAGTKKYHAKHDNDRTAASDAEEAISANAKIKRESTERLKEIVKSLVKIVADLVGVTDALNCFTQGDIGSCIATGATVLMSFVGGLAGKVAWKLIRHARQTFKLLDDAAKLVEKAVGEFKILKSCNSFLPGTRVLLSDGSSVPIENLKLGDRVTATDPETGISSSQAVVATLVSSGEKQLVDLTLTSDQKNGTALIGHIMATQAHRVYLTGSSQWVPAGDLKPGDLVGPPNGSVTSRVSAVRLYEAPATVYNLTVATSHTYYVVAAGAPILVHNDGGICRVVGGAPGGRPYMPFTRAGREKVIGANLEKHGLQTCEMCGRQVIRPLKSERGVTPPPDEWQVDHEIPRSKGGSGDPSNGQLLCRECNNWKSDR
jgi:RHS repeat-associated protein